MPLTPEEVTKLLNVIDITKQTGLRDYCIIYIMIITGLRISEALSIKPIDISLVNNVYYINIKGKGCSIKSQQVFFEHGQNAILDGYIECAVNEYLFVNSRDVSKNICSRNMQRRIKAYFTEIGLTGKFYTTHSLRHTTATILLEKGINIVDIQSYMRHTSVNTTQIYTAYMQNKKLKSLNVSSIINKSIL